MGASPEVPLLPLLVDGSFSSAMGKDRTCRAGVRGVLGLSKSPCSSPMAHNTPSSADILGTVGLLALSTGLAPCPGGGLQPGTKSRSSAGWREACSEGADGCWSQAFQTASSTVRDGQARSPGWPKAIVQSAEKLSLR